MPNSTAENGNILWLVVMGNNRISMLLTKNTLRVGEGRVFSQEGDALDFARKVLASRDAKGNVHKVYAIEERTIFDEIVPP